MIKRSILAFTVAAFSIVSSAKEIRNLHYHTETELAGGDDYMRSQCQLDLKYPDGKTGWPVVVWFHGGGLEHGHRHYPSLPSDIAVIAVGYRLHPKVNMPVFIEDAAAAVAWTLKNIEQYGGDSEKVFVSGHSAGGYLTAMTGMDPKWLAEHNLDHKKIAGLIPVSGQMSKHFNVKKWMGYTGPKFRPVVDKYAPLYHISGDLPPVCLITGGRDIEWPCRVEENELLSISLKKSGNKMVEFHEMNGLNHGTVGKGAMFIIPGFIRRVLNTNK
ncbi:MAG: alpha/beta hydrolase [Kiritimatiellia bacterium]